MRVCECMLVRVWVMECVCVCVGEGAVEGVVVE